MLLINIDKLDKAPKALRDYVSLYGKEILIFGKRCFAISQRTHWNHEDHNNYHNKRAGVGPSEVGRFKDGLPEGKDLADWLWEKGHEDIVARLIEVGERHESFIDDD